MHLGRRHIWRSSVQTGNTALICAVWKGHIDFARLLLDAGADKNAKEDEVRGLSVHLFFLIILLYDEVE
jgi:hypothetical protein